MELPKEHTPVVRRACVMMMQKWLSCPAALYDPSAQVTSLKGDVFPPKLGATTWLETALTTKYSCDQNVAQYIVQGPDGKILKKVPRLNKEGLAELESRGFKILFGAIWHDIDEPNHGKLSDKRWLAYQEVLEDIPTVWAYYRTRGGVRAIELLSRFLNPVEFEVLQQKRARALNASFYGLNQRGTDPQAKEWTSLMRLPLVIKRDKGKDIDLRHMPVVFRPDWKLLDPGECKPPIKIIAPKPKWILESAPQDTAKGLGALRHACSFIANSSDGDRHMPIYTKARWIASLVAGNQILDATARNALEIAIDAYPEHKRALWDGYEKGLDEPAEQTATRFDTEAMKARFERDVQELQDEDDVSF